MIFSIILGIIAVLAAIWIIYDRIAHNKKLSEGMIVLWILFAVIFSIITATEPIQ